MQTETPLIYNIRHVSDRMQGRARLTRAKLKVGNDYHILLMAMHTAVGPMAAIYDVKANKWWRERQWAEDIEDAKKKARSPFAFITGPSVRDLTFSSLHVGTGNGLALAS